MRTWGLRQTRRRSEDTLCGIITTVESSPPLVDRRGTTALHHLAQRSQARERIDVSKRCGAVRDQWQQECAHDRLARPRCKGSLLEVLNTLEENFQLRRNSLIWLRFLRNEARRQMVYSGRPGGLGFRT